MKNKYKVEYFDDTHTYCVDGVIVPSATKLVDFAIGRMYDNVPMAVLEKARLYGTAVHESIQDYEERQVESIEYSAQLSTYKELKKKYMLTVKNMEQIVNYEKHYCGRYDIMDNEGTLWDIKTTSKLHKDYLEWQLGLYYLALGVEKDVGYALWIPKKGSPKVELIKPKTNKECKELVEMYEKSLHDNANEERVLPVQEEKTHK